MIAASCERDRDIAELQSLEDYVKVNDIIGYATDLQHVEGTPPK